MKTFCLVPYRQPKSTLAHNQLFNELFSSARVKIEHVNGVLKGRWASLKGLPIQVKRKEDMVKVNRHVIACLILYNILIDLKDDWEEDEEIPVDENDSDVLFAAENGETEDAAKQLRILVQNSCLNWFYSH